MVSDLVLNIYILFSDYQHNVRKIRLKYEGKHEKQYPIDTISDRK